MKNPMQPIVVVDGVTRFKENRLVSILLDKATERGWSLNNLVGEDATQEDWEQFYQLIGYSLSGYGSLGRVSEASYDAAHVMAENPTIDERDARIEALETTLRQVREGMIEGAAILFQRHPDDLRGD